MLTHAIEKGFAMTNRTIPPLDQLLSALERGWRVQPPVYCRQQWHTGNGEKLGSYFVVKKDDEVDLLIVPDDDKTRQFIELQRLKVIAA